jgi:hypothetical protein
MRRIALLSGLAVLLLVPASASALSVSRAQLSGGRLHLEGSGAAPGITVVVRSAASAASARSDSKGDYRIDATNFRSDDCTVTVSDGRTPIATPTLSGCTPTPATPPAPPPPPSGSCVITPGAPATFNVGDLQTYFFTTTGCDTSNGPVQWTLTAGHIPPGMTGPFFQGQVAGAVSGRPTTEGTYAFTVLVTDSAGATDSETFTITVVGPRPLTVAGPSAAPAPGTRGQSYCCVSLVADGGLPGYSWTLRSGTLPPGIRLSGSTIAGTPTTRGTYSFTVRVTDSRGATAERTFSITIN